MARSLRPCRLSPPHRPAPELLRGRLIARKVQGGSTAEDAAAFYEASDVPNILRFAAHADAADEIWRMMADGDFVRE